MTFLDFLRSLKQRYLCHLQAKRFPALLCFLYLLIRRVRVIIAFLSSLFMKGQARRNEKNSGGGGGGGGGAGSLSKNVSQFGQLSEKIVQLNQVLKPSNISTQLEFGV